MQNFIQLSTVMEFFREKHVQYLFSLEEDKDKTLSSFRAESIRMGGLYWGLSSLLLLGVPVTGPQKEKLYKFILSCFNEEDGGFGWSSGHDAHITATHYAVLILAQLGMTLEEGRVEKTLKFVSLNQNQDGSFQCDRWGETDLRFAYDAVCILSILGKDIWKSKVNYPALIEWVNRCQNEDDGGFGPNPALESHAAYTFCAVGVLSIAQEEIFHRKKLSVWLSERQTVSGGFNGRPEKAPDVCYSWWIMSSLSMLGKSEWIDRDKLSSFILRSQEKIGGGIADRPECVPDVFHTFFGLAGLALIDRRRFGLSGVSDKYAIVLDA